MKKQGRDPSLTPGQKQHEESVVEHFAVAVVCGGVWELNQNRRKWKRKRKGAGKKENLLDQ